MRCPCIRVSRVNTMKSGEDRTIFHIILMAENYCLVISAVVCERKSMITWDCSTIWIRCGSRVRRLRSNEIFEPCRKTWMTHIILKNYFDCPSFILLTLPWTRGWIWSPSQNLDHGCIKDQLPYPNQVQDSKPQSGISSILQSPKRGLKGHGWSLHLQNQDREPKFGSWVYQRPVTIS